MSVFDDSALVLDDEQVMVVIGVFWVTDRLKFPIEDRLCLSPT